MPDAEYEAKYGTGPHYAADAVVYCEKHLLLVQRLDGLWALPGGFREGTETYAQTAIRECQEETGVLLDKDWQVRPEVYGEKDRDPRSWVITVATLFIIPRSAVLDQPVTHQPEELLAAEWKHISTLPQLKFFADHEKIIREALDHVRKLG